MDAIKVTRQNFGYVMEYVIKNAPWAADFKNIFESNINNGEWTYVYTKTRGEGERAKTSYFHMTASKFNNTFKFVTTDCNFLTMPITAM